MVHPWPDSLSFNRAAEVEPFRSPKFYWKGLLINSSIFSSLKRNDKHTREDQTWPWKRAHVQPPLQAAAVPVSTQQDQYAACGFCHNIYCIHKSADSRGKKKNSFWGVCSEEVKCSGALYNYQKAVNFRCNPVWQLVSLTGTVINPVWAVVKPFCLWTHMQITACISSCSQKTPQRLHHNQPSRLRVKPLHPGWGRSIQGEAAARTPTAEEHLQHGRRHQWPCLQKY